MSELDIFGTAELGEAERRELVRKHLQNLITSYADEADVFTELIQNAIDAIVERQQHDPQYTGQLNICIGRRSNNSHYVYVQDDGVGMTDEVATKVFVPGYSHGKKPGRAIGHKGVGMSYVIAVSDHLSMVSTRGEGDLVQRTVRYTNAWVNDSEKPFPEVSAEFVAPTVVTALAADMDRGTGVFYTFHSGHAPKTLDGIVIVGDGADKEVDYWASFLCARTALGVAPGSGTPSSAASLRPIAVRLILDHGEDDPTVKGYTRSSYDMSPAKNTLGYPFPDHVFKVGVDIQAIDSTSPGLQHVHHARKHPAVFHEWAGKDLIDEIANLDEDERELLSTHLLWVRGYLAYSTDVLKQVKSMMGTRSAVVRYGARLVVDQAPQGRPLDLALTSDQGLDRQTHIVLGFKSLQLDTGRKFISDERILSAVNKVNQRVVTKLKEYRWALKVKNLPDVSSDLKSWISAIAARAGNSIIPELFEHLKAMPPTRVDPANEQEVIALWTALLTVKTLPGYQMQAISGFNRYDALVTISQPALDPDPHSSIAPVTTDDQPKDNAVLEFKHDFTSVIQDFEQKVKAANEVDYVVCWDCPELNLTRGHLEPAYGSAWGHSRPARGVSYVWHDDNDATTLNVIALRNLVAELLVQHGSDAGKAALGMLEARDREKLI